MNINITMFPARNGDCFLVRINKRYVLIDGGYFETYSDSLRKYLFTISSIDLAVVTHIDEDHITGVIAFVEENGCAKVPNVVAINQVWYNGYNQLPGKKHPRELTREEIEILHGYFMPTNKQKGITEKQISGTQGMCLSHLLLEHGYNWNLPTSGKAICTEDMHCYSLDSNIKITLLSPTRQQLLDLEHEWLRVLKRKKWSFTLTDNPLFNSAMEAFLLSDAKMSDIRNVEISKGANNSIDKLVKQTAKADPSKTNASSIAFMLQAQNKNMLFLADANENNIITAVENLCIHYFDVIKVAHHGSLCNANNIFDYIDGRIFLISTDGSRHGHPDFLTLAKIITRKCDIKRTLIFNYDNEAYRYFNDLSLMERYNYNIKLSRDGLPIAIE